jgi:hypothetical protein
MAQPVILVYDEVRPNDDSILAVYNSPAEALDQAARDIAIHGHPIAVTHVGQGLTEALRKARKNNDPVMKRLLATELRGRPSRRRVPVALLEYADRDERNRPVGGDLLADASSIAAAVEQLKEFEKIRDETNRRADYEVRDRLHKLGSGLKRL